MLTAKLPLTNLLNRNPRSFDPGFALVSLSIGMDTFQTGLS
jgi:hypothetical protein